MARRDQRTAWAWALSLGLHLIVLALLGAYWTSSRSATPSQPLQIRLLTLADHHPQRSPVRVRQEHLAPLPKKPASRSHAASASAQSPSRLTQEDDSSESDFDQPKRFRLTPSTRSPVLSTGPLYPADPHGHLIRNQPGWLPSPQELRRQEQLTVKGRVDDWIADDMAEQRVEAGVVDGYFYDLRKALERHADHPPPFQAQGPLSQAWASYSNSMQSYGKSGNPYPNGAPDVDSNHDPISQLALQQDMNTGRAGWSLSEGYANMAQMLATLRDLHRVANDASGPTAIVELRQDSHGALEKVTLLSSSGNTGFDAYVLTAAPTALESLPPPPDHGVGLHPDGIRSVWAFMGRLSFQKQLKDYGAKDVPYLAGATAVATLLGGSGVQFDETSGVSIPDVRDPRYTCRVKLLRVY